jgi:hypothetical protein
MAPPAPDTAAPPAVERTWLGHVRVMGPVLMALGLGIALLPLYLAVTGSPRVDPWLVDLAIGIFFFEVGLAFWRLKLHVTSETITVVNLGSRWEIPWSAVRTIEATRGHHASLYIKARRVPSPSEKRLGIVRTRSIDVTAAEAGIAFGRRPERIATELLAIQATLPTEASAPCESDPPVARQVYWRPSRPRARAMIALLALACAHDLFVLVF